MANLPDGVDYRAMQYAVAWEMTLIAVRDDSEFYNGNPEKRLQMLRDAFSKAYDAVENSSFKSES